MYWANFLHVYQPPTQKEIWVRRIGDESYRKVFFGLLDIPKARLTLNINGVLCELLEKYGGNDILDAIRKLVDRGTVELTGSAKYHAFLPLLPESEIERQIILNEETLNRYFGAGWKKGGFFPPEMAYSKKVATVAKRLGYRWLIIDELGFPDGKRFDPGKLYTIAGFHDFYVFFRERTLSFAILSAKIGTLSTLKRHVEPRLKNLGYAVTAMDGETFGHHRPGLEYLLFDLLKDKDIQTVTISDLLSKISSKEEIEPLDSTWAATKQNLLAGTPFARWQSKDNPVQTRQWKLTYLAIDVVNRAPDHEETRRLLDQATHSDQYWWASARPWWSLEMIERGAHELKELILKAPKARRKEKELAEELYKEILFLGFEWQRSGIVDELSRQENEEVRERLDDKGKLFITKAEYQQMIDTLTEQMHTAAGAEEYHRASMIKDRIRELREEMEKTNV